jgi:hypothetical protein
MADVVVNAGLEQMVTKGEFSEFKADTKREFRELKDVMATKTDLNDLRNEIKNDMDARFEKMQAEFNAKIETVVTMIKSQQTKTELGGVLVPAPAEGVVDENQMILVDNVALFKRFKGRVLILRRVAIIPKKRWKYE